MRLKGEEGPDHAGHVNQAQACGFQPQANGNSMKVLGKAHHNINLSQYKNCLATVRRMDYRGPKIQITKTSQEAFVV